MLWKVKVSSILVTREYEVWRDEGATTYLIPPALVQRCVDAGHPGEVPPGAVAPVVDQSDLFVFVEGVARFSTF